MKARALNAEAQRYSTKPFRLDDLGCRRGSVEFRQRLLHGKLPDDCESVGIA